MNREIYIDTLGLQLPDGRNPNELDRFALARTLIELGIDGIDPETPKQESLVAYRDHCQAVAEAERKTQR